MNKYKFLFFICLKMSYLYAQAQTLEQYVQTAIESNQSIKQQNFMIEKSLYALQEAKGLFLPSVNFATTYTLAKGGRLIALPIGDLMNPVYSTLNLLTNSNNFPQISNVNEQFLPNNFYDARFKIQQPIINYEIAYNQKIKHSQIELQKIEIEIFKKELTKEVKVAYFRYLQATQAIKIYENALQLIEENKRINESLVRNDMANNTVLLRIEGEKQKLEAKKLEAQNNQRNASVLMNFLLNQTLDTPLNTDTTFFKPLLMLPEITGSVKKRAELTKLQLAKNVQDNALMLYKSAYYPKLGAGLDLGSQAFNWKFDSQSRYVLLGINLEVPIFNGFRNQSKIKQAQMDLAGLETQTKQAENQLQLVNQLAQNNYENTWKVYQTFAPQLKAYQKNYQDLLKRYKEGQATFIETLQAQNDLISTQLQQSVAFFDIWIKKAELERTLN